MHLSTSFNSKKMEVQQRVTNYEDSQRFKSLNDDNFLPSSLHYSSKIDETQLLNSLSESVYRSPPPKMKLNKHRIEDSLSKQSYSSPLFNRTVNSSSNSSSSSSSSSSSTETSTKTPLKSLIRAISRDNKASLITQQASLNTTFDRATASRLLHVSCEFDSWNCAAALLNGEVCGVVPLVNEVEASTGHAPLHTAAEYHSTRCIELLLRKRARTDLKTRKTSANNNNNNNKNNNDKNGGGGGGGRGGGGSGRLPLELSLRSVRMDIKWGPHQPLDDLLLILSEKDLGAISILSEKTTETAEVAYTIAMEGRVGALAALLMVAADKVTGSVFMVRNHSELVAEKTTVYNSVIKEAVSIFSLSREKQKGTEEEIDHGTYHGVGAKERRMLLLREIELLHFFGASRKSIGHMSKKAISPLMMASQAGDEEVMRLLLKMNIDVNEVDAEGNSALHWCLKASRVLNPEKIRILQLLLKHGARVRQKDKWGLTAVHLAAGSGNIEALEILLSRDPDSVNITSELKETALFLAAKNDLVETAQLLLRFGASTEIHNLRRERPIELAKSQKMRAALNRTSVVITNKDSKQKYMVQNGEVVWTGEVLLKETCSSSESVNSSSEGDICKYFLSATGCVRGSSCFYKHGEEELSNKKTRSRVARSLALQEFKRKIFVGGLPVTIDSESLASIMEDKFGPVVEAKVLEMEIDGQTLSRGFGFVTFKDEKSVASALEAHYTEIWGKKVEMKTAVPKCLLTVDGSEDESPRKEFDKETVKEAAQQKTRQLSGEELCRNDMSSPSSNKNEQTSWANRVATSNKNEQTSWANRVAKPHPEESVDDRSACKGSSTVRDTPKWLKVLRKWLPNFLKKMARNAKGEYYSLSSLKTDFKAIFGLDLDHNSLGYPKLSDFVKSNPGLCTIKVINTGGVAANHMILLPPKASRPPPLVISKAEFPSLRARTPVHEHVDSPKIESDKDILSSSSSETSSDAAVATTVVGDTVENVKMCSTDTLPVTNPRFLQFLAPDPIFLARTWRGGFKALDEQFRPKHLVLEHLAQQKKEVFFLRSIQFYNDYVASVSRGICFGCGDNRLVWANYPCQHLVWCSDCKLKAMRVAEVGTLSHKCVVCDHVVNKIDLSSWAKLQFQSCDNMEFPSIHTAYLRSQKLRA